MKTSLRLLCFCSLMGGIALLGASSGAQELELRTFPSSAPPGYVASLIVGFAGPVQKAIEEVNVSLVLPEGVASFFGGAVGGRCSNLLDNCYGGVRLSWSIARVSPGQRIYFIVPLEVELEDSVSRSEIWFTAVANWRGGGGLVEAEGLRVGDLVQIADWASTSYSDGLRLEYAMTPLQGSSQEVVVGTLTVVNETERVVDDAVVRVVVPAGIASFLGGVGSGNCYNLRNNCYPGELLSWEPGPLEGGSRKSIQLPLKVRSDLESWLGVCAVASAGTVSGSAACVGVSYVREP